MTATPGTLCHALTLRACQAAGFTPRIRHQIDEFATVLSLAAAAQGIALVPHLAALTPPPGVHLAPLPLHRRTHIAHRTGATHHPAIQALTTALHRAAPPTSALLI
nr:LysR substrate-binding domain-containing protein [Phaeacidiphilus oryzae]